MTITRPTNLQKAWAESGTKATILVPSQIGITDGKSSYTDGVPPLCMASLVAGGVPPSGPEANGILYNATAHLLLQNSGGRYRFDSTISSALGGYPAGAVLQSNDGLNEYVNTVDGNTIDFNSNPASIGSTWLPYAGSSAFVSPGNILMRLKSTVPTGYLECDGSAILRATYSSLFANIGTTYGAGNGSTTFNIPDYRGYFLRFWAHGSAVDPDRLTRTDRGDGTTGDSVGTKQAQGIESHAHYFTWQSSISGSVTGKMVLGHLYNNQWSTPTPYNMGYAGSTETRPVNINVMYIVKY